MLLFYLLFLRIPDTKCVIICAVKNHQHRRKADRNLFLFRNEFFRLILTANFWDVKMVCNNRHGIQVTVCLFLSNFIYRPCVTTRNALCNGIIIAADDPVALSRSIIRVSNICRRQLSPSSEHIKQYIRNLLRYPLRYVTARRRKFA